MEFEPGVVAAAAPPMSVLGPVINQQENSRVPDRFDQQVEQRLRPAVYPMKILEYQN